MVMYMMIIMAASLSATHVYFILSNYWNLLAKVLNPGD